MQIHDYRVKFEQMSDWQTFLEEFRRGNLDKTCIIRFQIGEADVFYSENIKGEEVTFQNLQDIIALFSIGDLHSYDEYICITFIVYHG